MRCRTVRRLAFAILAIAGGAASAATGTATIGVSGTVVSRCSVATTPLNFGAAIPTPVAANVDGSSTLLVTCSNGTPFYVSMNAGSGAGATVAQRRMSAGAATLNYMLYMNPTRTVSWGDGSLGTYVGTATGTGATATYGIWGRIPTGQSPALGTYNDVVTVTLTF